MGGTGVPGIGLNRRPSERSWDTHFAVRNILLVHDTGTGHNWRLSYSFYPLAVSLFYDSAQFSHFCILLWYLSFVSHAVVGIGLNFAIIIPGTFWYVVNFIRISVSTMHWIQRAPRWRAIQSKVFQHGLSILQGWAMKRASTYTRLPFIAEFWRLHRHARSQSS